MSKKFTSTIAGASILITGVGFISRGFGFIREVVYANNFGLQTSFDVYLIGAVLPVILNTSVIYLAQNYFIPVYHNKLSDGEEAAKKFLKNCFWLFVISSIIISFILYLISPYIINAYFSKNDFEQNKLALKVFQIFLFTIPFNAGYSILASYSQAEFNFKSPAISTLFQNVIIITLVLLFSKSIGIFTIPFGYLLGTITQFIYLFISVKKKGINLFNDLSFHPKELGFANKILFLTIVVEVINQLYVLIDRYFYGRVDAGGIAALNYAFVLYSLPITLFSIALSTAILPRFSQSFNLKDHITLKAQFSNGIKVNIFMFIPLTFIFIYFGNSIIRLFYQRGNFTSGDTFMTFEILRIYAFSMIFFSSYAVINKIIYGAGLIKNLLYISLIVLLLKVILNFLLVDKMKQDGLALSSTVSYILLSLGCFILVVKKLKFNNLGEFFFTVLFYIFNGLIAYVILLILKPILQSSFMVNLLLEMSIFITIYFLNLSILKPHEYLIFQDIFLKVLKR